MNKIFSMVFLLLPCLLVAQEMFPVNDISDRRPESFAFTQAVIHLDYQSTINASTLLISKGRVVAAGNNVHIPEDAVVIDVQGAHIYPSFIDLFSDYGIQAPSRPAREERWSKARFESSRKGAYGWNEAIHPETRADELWRTDEKTAADYRKQGFGTVLTHLHDGIARGSGVLVTLGNRRENEEIVKGIASAHYAFDKGSSLQDYPTSLMGAIALLRQSYLDAQWYAASRGAVPYNISLDAWNRIQSVPQIFAVDDVLSLLRADKIGDEFGVQYIIKGGGDEYQRVAEVRATGAALVIPVNYPEAYDVEDPFDALNVNLADMKHWELAPYNPAILHAAGIAFSLTATGLKDRNDFLPNVRKAVKNGLPKEAALKALTYTPAHLLGVSDKLGSLTEGSLANFIITSGDIFDEETAILENWIQGRKYVVNDTRPDNIDGTYSLQAGNLRFQMMIEGSPFKTKAQVVMNDSVKNEVQFSRKDNLVTLAFNASASKDSTRIIRLSGLMEEKKWSGRGQLPDGSWVNWEATLEKVPEKKEKKSPSPAPAQPGKVFYPFTAYGYTEYPRQETVLIKNATVWTNEKEGILQHADVLIKDGKIAAVGRGLSDAAARVIDATGKHVTSGIIDEHSHIAISGGVNEGSHASSAEVRIGDVVNSEDINIYRQLAGGVVVAQLLHGSANPIGGQSQIIKLRWGFPPEKMKLENAPQFIKFALGENVKRSNWEQPYLRYPQSRMGVEQIFEDYFTRAKEYLRLQGARPGRPSKTKAEIITPRRDLEMEALAEVLAGKRFITCHSYVQSEIVMLMRLAERLGFRVNTFTHILEGYKVADKMKAHGAKASTFSDWWAYKYEVIDAIPYNAALLIKSGVETAINSDDAEMGRRLNQEAAKTIKYGGLSEEEAWKTVTLYPARMLHIDNRTGSIKPGKDADIVIWSDYPLSVYTKAEKTFVDGICFYDIEKDEILRQEIAQERARLIQKMLEAKKAGEKTQKVASSQQRIYHCDDLEGHRD